MAPSVSILFHTVSRLGGFLSHSSGGQVSRRDYVAAVVVRR